MLVDVPTTISLVKPHNSSFLNGQKLQQLMHTQKFMTLKTRLFLNPIKETIILAKETKLKPGKTSIIFDFATYFARTSRRDVTKVKTNWPFLRSPAHAWTFWNLKVAIVTECVKVGKYMLKYGSNATTYIVAITWKLFLAKFKLCWGSWRLLYTSCMRKAPSCIITLSTTPPAASNHYFS